MSEHNSISNIIKDINYEIQLSHNIPENFLYVAQNTDGSESIWLREPVTGKKTKLAFNYNVKGRKNDKYFSFSIKNILVSKIEIPADAELKTLSSDKINTYVIFRFWNYSTTNFIKDVVVYYVETFEPSDKFGCCGKYLECSKAEKCLHNNKFYAKACWYRKNLESGNIFY